MTKLLKLSQNVTPNIQNLKQFWNCSIGLKVTKGLCSFSSVSVRTWDVHCMLYYVHRVQWVVWSLHCVVCSVKSSVCSVQCAVCSVQSTVCSVQCTVCSIQCAVCCVLCAGSLLAPESVCSSISDSILHLLVLSSGFQAFPLGPAQYRGLSITLLICKLGETRPRWSVPISWILIVTKIWILRTFFSSRGWLIFCCTKRLRDFQSTRP